MTKESILAEIRRTAAENGGVPLGRAKFLQATGIRESDWSGRFWSSWSAAVQEAGFEPQSMNPRLDDQRVLLAAVQIVRKLGRFPTAAEIRLECATDANLPSHNTFRRFGGISGLRDSLLSFAEARALTDVVELLRRADDEATTPDETSEAVLDSGFVDGFVYLIKSGRHFKVGKANSVAQRFRQLKIQLPQAAEVVHSIKTDDPYGIERYWHERFAPKRLNGEWFALSAEDVKAFRRRKFM